MAEPAIEVIPEDAPSPADDHTNFYYSSEDDTGSLNDAYFMLSSTDASPTPAALYALSPPLQNYQDAIPGNAPLSYSPTSPDPITQLSKCQILVSSLSLMEEHHRQQAAGEEDPLTIQNGEYRPQPACPAQQGSSYGSIYPDRLMAGSPTKESSVTWSKHAYKMHEISWSIHEDYPHMDIDYEGSTAGGPPPNSRPLPMRQSNNTQQSKYDRRRQRHRRFQQRSREHWVRQIRGKPQFESKERKDVVFAVLFLLQFLAIVVCAITLGGEFVFVEESDTERDVPDDYTAWDTGWHGRYWINSPGELQATGAASDGSGARIATDDLGLADDDLIQLGMVANLTANPEKINFTIEYHTVLAVCGVTGFYACILSTLTVGFMLIIAKSLIPTTLVFSILVALGWGVVGVAIHGGPFGVIPLGGFAATLLTIVYTICVWDRIPFAATNLHIALSAMRCTADITFMAMIMIQVAFGYSVLWAAAFIGIVDSLDGYGSVVLYIVLIGSFIWTNLVIKNIVQTTVASVVGTWWFAPESISPCCTMPVKQALCRSVTTSFGSICKGSLLVPPGQIVNVLCNMIHVVSNLVCLGYQGKASDNSVDENKSREGGVSETSSSSNNNSIGNHNGNGTTTTAVPACRWCCNLLTEIKNLLRACNRWSFIYIGLYGYSFSESGRKAVDLFETREWVKVVNDNLIPNVLFMASIVISGSTGTFGVLVEEVDGYTFTSFHTPVTTAFLIGCTFGSVLSSILLSGVIGSAVNTVLVCFAAGPFEFNKNHPRLSHEMREVWSQQVWEPAA